MTVNVLKSIYETQRRSLQTLELQRSANFDDTVNYVFKAANKEDEETTC